MELRMGRGRAAPRGCSSLLFPLLLLSCPAALHGASPGGHRQLHVLRGDFGGSSIQVAGGGAARGGGVNASGGPVGNGVLPPDSLPVPGTVHPDAGSVELLSWKPRLYLYRKFMSGAECDHIIKLATPSMTKSTVVDTATGKSVDSQIRTSHGTFLRRGQDEVVADVERRIAEFSMVPADHGEGVQILRYERGQKYEAHYDYFHDQWNADPSKGGQRVATMLMYLSDVASGGETVFPQSLDRPEYSADERSACGRGGLSVRPRKGDAVLFFSLDLQQQLDPASLHGGCPVVEGTKWSATKWMHVNPFTLEGGPPRTGCKDYHAMCDVWAAAGECQKNSAYMTGSDGSAGDCKKACKACTGD